MFHSPTKVDAKITPEAAMYILLDEVNGRLVDLQKMLSGETDQQAQPFSSMTVDLTTARNNFAITNKLPFKYLQVFCDGGLSGITIRMGDQSAEPLDISQIGAIPITNNPPTLYLSNDVRQGRTSLTLYWVRGSSLDINKPSNDISLSEHAVRLGSVKSIDRRGEMVFMEGFENNLGNISITNTASGSAAISTNKSKSGECSLMYKGPASNDESVISIIPPYVNVNRNGFEVAFNPSPLVTSTFIITRYQGAFLYSAQIKVANNGAAPPANLWDISLYDNTGSWKAIASVPANSGFNILKLVVDFTRISSTCYYSRLIFNGTNYDLSQNPVFSDVIVGNSANRVFLSIDALTRSAGASAIAYYDDVILTENEP